MKRILLTLSSVGALALASCSSNYDTATGAACPSCGKQGCTSCAAGEACPHCGKKNCNCHDGADHKH